MTIIRRDHLKDIEEEIDLDQVWFDVDLETNQCKMGTLESLEARVDLLYTMLRDHIEGKLLKEILVNAANKEVNRYSYRIEENDTTKQN
jgi:hypothetical protein